ncbi:MAG: HAMP domain-containing protein [Polyangiaceae bacterium]|nr:HAMP domain-containing protein [Polyangiaceae bacterium]
MSFIFYAAQKEREAALERLETEARHLGSLASREHAYQLNGAKSLLRRLGDTLACRAGADPTPPACPPYLPALLSGFPQFANIGVAAPGGEVSCSAAPIAPSARLAHNTAFERALRSDDVEVGDYVVGFVGRPVLHLAQAIRGRDGEPCAVSFVAVELGWLDALAEQANLPADYSLLISDRAGHVLARSGAVGADPVAEQERAIAGLAEALERPEGAVLAIGSPPVSRYFVAAPMEGIPGVFAVAGLPYERVQGTANRAFYRTLLVLALVTVFAIAGAILAAELSVLRVLRALTRAVRRFGSGDLSARVPLPGGHGELRELALSFAGMADALGARQREAREAQDQLRALSHRLQAARDEEAGRIARELHDELGQVLTGLKMDLARVRRVCVGHHVTAGEEAVVAMSAELDGAIDTVRRLSSELRPPVLDRLGLAAAVDWLVRDCGAKAGLAIQLEVGELREPIDAAVSTAVFRIVQEALTNVVRHAGATEVRVELSSDATTIRLVIRDDGRGIDPAAAAGAHALGILGMRERVGLLGGTFALDAPPGKGTTVVVAVPREPARATDRAAADREHGA